MSIKVEVFEDFHVRGASAPEWNQRYVQLSAGAMRSTLTEATSGDVHVFRKWMSGQVVQQGCLPPGRICFALLNGGTGRPPRVQRRELHEDDLFVLRSGEEFTIQRPGGMELLAVTLPVEDFLRAVEDGPWNEPVRRLLARQVLRVPTAPLQRLRAQLLDLLAAPRNDRATADGDGPMMANVLLASLCRLLDDASGAHEALSSASSGRIVAESGEAPPDIEALCRRLHTSRRRLQDSFRQVADTTAGHYLRGVRLNLVHRRLLATSAHELSVSQAAADQGFGHLSHFTERYKALFGELPSQTKRQRVEAAS